MGHKQTALQFFLTGLIDLEIGKDMPTDKVRQLHDLYHMAKEMEKHQQDTFAIDFAEWYEEDVLAKEEDVLAKGDYEMIAKDKKKLLEIFKETYGKQ